MSNYSNVSYVSEFPGGFNFFGPQLRFQREQSLRVQQNVVFMNHFVIVAQRRLGEEVDLTQAPSQAIPIVTVTLSVRSLGTRKGDIMFGYD